MPGKERRRLKYENFLSNKVKPSSSVFTSSSGSVKYAAFFKQGPGTDSVVFAVLAHPASLTRMEISGQILPNSTGELPGNPYIMGILRTANWCFYLRKHHRHWSPKIGIGR